VVVCDNFASGAFRARSLQDGAHSNRNLNSAASLESTMVEQLEQEYLALKDKVRELRDYL
jgi:hypothetical protein